MSTPQILQESTEQCSVNLGTESSVDFSEAMLKYFFKYPIYFMQPSTDQKQEIRVSQFIGNNVKVLIAN